MKTKKTPLRKCVACGAQKDKRDLLRVVNNKEEGISVDLTGKKNGRGAYVCRSLECIEKAEKNKNLNHRLKANIDKTLYEEIKAYVKEDL